MKAKHIYTNSCANIKSMDVESEQQILQRICIGNMVKLSTKA